MQSKFSVALSFILLNIATNGINKYTMERRGKMGEWKGDTADIIHIVYHFTDVGSTEPTTGRACLVDVFVSI